eukprot:SAG22_NODE_5697_length_970_cov_0.974742_1_plen_41_part_10
MTSRGARVLALGRPRTTTNASFLRSGSTTMHMTGESGSTGS